MEHCKSICWCLMVVLLVTSSPTVGGSPSKMFKVFDTLATNLADAMAQCASIGMTLATIENHNETLLAQAVTSTTEHLYFTAGVFVDRWTWITDGRPIGPYTQWYGKYPDADKCLKFNAVTSPANNWASYACGHSSYALCQYYKTTATMATATAAMATATAKAAMAMATTTKTTGDGTPMATRPSSTVYPGEMAGQLTQPDPKLTDPLAVLALAYGKWADVFLALAKAQRRNNGSN